MLQVLDFGAARDGVSEANRGRRVVVDARGHELREQEVVAVEVEPAEA